MSVMLMLKLDVGLTHNQSKVDHFQSRKRRQKGKAR
jgi:hypothetical protein